MEINISNTIFTGKFLLNLLETASTNHFAKLWLSKNKPIDGAVILAESQTAGRGQAGASWWASPGLNLTFSIIYLPTFLKIQDQYFLSMAVATGIREVLQKVMPSVNFWVKWPNDIMAGNKKIAGILIENSISGHTIQNTVIGIGLNVLEKEFPGLPNATSLGLEGWKGDFIKLFEQVLGGIEKNYLLLKKGESKRIADQYLEHLFMMEKECLFEDKNGFFRGKISGIGPDGALFIKADDGMRKYYFKEVTLHFAGEDAI